MSAPLHLDLAAARAAVLAVQGLSRPAASNAIGVVEETGFVRTLGGADVYLAVAARLPGVTRADLDAAVLRGDLRVLPAVRGCIYLVPRRDAGVALRLAARLTARRTEREHAKAGITAAELASVAEAVAGTLAERGPMTPQALRGALPEGLVRSLGDVGKKLGISSTLPPALRQLENEGRIERALEGGRLDGERYLWRVPTTSVFETADVPDDEVELAARLAEVFLRAAGFGDVAGFAAWSGLGKRDAAAALDRLATVPVEVAGRGDLVCLASRRELVAAPPDPGDTVALLPFEDNAVALHDGPAFLVDAAFHDVELPVWGRGGPLRLGDARHAALRAVVADGRLAGFWEFDPDTGRVVTGLFAAPSQATAERLTAEADRVTTFLRDEIGHARTTSIDSEDAIRARCRRVGEISAKPPSVARPRQ